MRATIWRLLLSNSSSSSQAAAFVTASPSADHAGVHPQGSRVVVWFDDDSSVTVSGLHIAAIEKEAAKKNGSAS